MTLRSHIAAMCLTATLAACATPDRSVKPAAAPAPTAAAVVSLPVAAESREPPHTLLAKRQLKPMPVRPLNASADCGFRDETGYNGTLNLDVQEAWVTRFDAMVDIPKRGSCRFHLKDFDQFGTLPAVVVLTARKGSCKIRLWEQGAQVTVVFRNCRSECSGASADYLWPILIDGPDGACS